MERVEEDNQEGPILDILAITIINDLYPDLSHLTFNHIHTSSIHSRLHPIALSSPHSLDYTAQATECVEGLLIL